MEGTVVITRFIKDSWTRFGPVDTAVLLGLTALERLFYVHKLEVMILDSDSLDPKFRAMPEMFQAGFLDRDTLLELSSTDQELDQDREFVVAALDKGDRCFAIHKGEEVVSYGWYSREPTRISGDLLFSFNPDYVYMYKGYTKPDYRGFRLHGVGMSAALLAYENDGCKAIVSYVKRNNLASLRSVYRMGYRKIGSIVFIGRTHRICRWRTPGCKEANVTLRQNPQLRPVRQPYAF